MDITIDLHGPPWLTPADAAQVGRALEPYDLLFVEDPIAPENLDGYRRIRDAAHVPLAAGERMATIFGERELIERELVDVIQPDTGRAGGITQMRKIAAMAEAHHIMMAPHSGSLGPVAEYAALHLLAAIPNALMLERIEDDWPGRAQTVMPASGSRRTAISPCPTRRASASTSTRSSSRSYPSEAQRRRCPVTEAAGSYAQGTFDERVYVQTRLAARALFHSSKDTAMKIDRLRAFMTRDKDRPRVIVAIDTDDGLTGWGECYNHGPDKALPPLLDYLFEFIDGQDPRRIEYPDPDAAAAEPLSAGRARPRRPSRRSTIACGTSRRKALDVPVYMLLGGHARDRVRVYAGVYTAPDPADARDQLDRAERANGASPPSSSAPTGSTCTRHRWGEVVRTSGRLFPPAARDGALATTRSPSTPTPRSSSRGRRCSSATRSRPTIRCSSRSRSGPRTSRPGAS